MRKRILCLILALCLTASMSTALADMSEHNLRSSEAIIKFIKQCESFSAKPYSDGDRLAIGYGTQVGPNDYLDGITEEYADYLMRSHMSLMEEQIEAMERKLGIRLSQNQFDALASLSYNIGTGWLGTNYRLYNMLAAGMEFFSDENIISAFGNYSFVGDTINELVLARRLAEAKIFLYSDYKTGGTQNYEFELDYEAEYAIKFEAEGGLTKCLYSDISSKDWYYRYVSPLTYSGVVEGLGDGIFAPNGALTCGEALKLIPLAAGYPAQSEDGEHWAVDYLDLAYDEGYLNHGVVTDLDAPISRLLMAEITARALGMARSSAPSPFADCNNGYVVALYEAGLVEGSVESETGNRVYLPKSNLTRAEMCAIVWRIRNGEL